MAMVEVLDRLLDPDRDEQADDDRDEMNQEVLPGVDRAAGRVHFVYRHAELRACV